jgi:two-component system NtrC family sensor kinase
MTDPTSSDQMADASLKRHLDELVVMGLIGSTAIQAGAVAYVWGEWVRVATIIAAWLTMFAINWAITAFAFPRIGSEGSEDLRLIPNVVLISIAGHASAWSIAALLFLPFGAVMVGGLQTGRPTGRLIITTGAIAAIALLDHAPPPLVAAFAGMAIFWHVVGQSHTRFARALLRQREQTLAELAQTHENLTSAQQSAIAHEKLASIGLLAAGVAHEINNPMCYVTANVRAMFEDLSEARELSPQLVEYRDDILPSTLDGIRRVNAIVADLRRFARGEPETSMQFDLVEEVESAMRMSHAQLKPDQRLTLEAAARPKVWGMPRQIGQVALNLIVNAIQASEPRGAIVISVGSTDDEGSFAVRDLGIGLSPEVRARLFLPFFTTTAPGEGTGLGLAVAHGIIQAQGGRITVSSEAGKGTCFEVFLPLRPLSPPRPSPPENPSARAGAGRGRVDSAARSLPIAR